MESLIDILTRLSFLAVAIPDLAELDVNPLIVSDSGCRAVDARILW
jgi:acetyltransferase